MDIGSVITEQLIESKLAGCVNIIPEVRSIYKSEDEFGTDNALLLIIKSRASLFEKIKEKILTLHTYDVPEIRFMQISNGHKSYLKWILDNTGL